MVAKPMGLCHGSIALTMEITLVDNARGGLFPERNKRNDKAPDYTGNVEVSREFLQALMAETGSGTYKAKIAAWIKEGRNGKFLSVSLEAPYKGGSRKNGSDDPPF